MGKVWVLDTETKGTGAEMVPLEKVLRRPEREHRRAPLPRPSARAPRRPEPAPPPVYRVVDGMTREVVVESADARATVDRLASVPRIVDVSIYVWSPAEDRWRLLSQRDRKLLWRAA